MPGPYSPHRVNFTSPKYHGKTRSPMKVVLIYRKQRQSGHSIEGLFDAIGDALKRHVDVYKYEVGSRWAIPLDTWRLRSMRADVYHITGDVHYFALLLPPQSTVLTVLDIYHYSKQLRGIKRWLYKWIWMLLPIRRAGTVTAISTETKRTIQFELGISEKEIAVIPCCVNPVFRATPKHFNVQRPVILQVGTRPNKNLERLIEALSGIQCLLSIIGPLTEQVRAKLRKFGIVFENYVDLSLHEVVQKYVAADLVCFASLYEGFGLPIIEANAIGRPVITSFQAPMLDVAGDAACFANPNDTLSIRDGILRIIRDAQYRESLVANGLRNADRYLPDLVAKRYVQVYAERIENS
jgi:glycosyltransferase involved in cell wall biosynthesis